MLSYSGIAVLSFPNKVVKVQPQKYIRSLYGVPRTLHLVSEVGFVNTPTGHQTSRWLQYVRTISGKSKEKLQNSENFNEILRKI